MSTTLLLYIALLLLYRLAEGVAMARSGTLPKPSARDWTVWLIIVPYWLVILGAGLEAATSARPPALAARVAGGLLFLAAAAVRAKAHLDLHGGFSMFLVMEPGQELVTRGIYRHIRHPLYLANLLLFVACPLFVGAGYTWIATAAGFVGVLVRIAIEERFLLARAPEYAAYRERTARLIPWLY